MTYALLLLASLLALSSCAARGDLDHPVVRQAIALQNGGAK